MEFISITAIGKTSMVKEMLKLLREKFSIRILEYYNTQILYIILYESVREIEEITLVSGVSQWVRGGITKVSKNHET